VDFSLALFDGALMQVQHEEEPEVFFNNVPPAPLAPIVVRRLRAILPEDERKRRQVELAKKKRLNWKIKGLKEKVKGLKAKKRKFGLLEKKIKAAVAAHKCTNKALLARLIAAKRKVEEFEEQHQFEVLSSKEVAVKSISLEKKISAIAKILMNNGVKLMPTQL